MYLIDRGKRLLHADLIANPSVHAWVLNLYLNGERYPQTVGDYFPSEFAPFPQLAGDLSRHRDDEHKHELLFAKAIASLGEAVVDLPRVDVFNVVVRACTPNRYASFHISESDSTDARCEKLCHFLAHAHFLEKRVARSLEYHVDACAARGSHSVARQVSAVLRDEERHVGYTLNWIFELVPRAKAIEIIALHRKAERRANLAFSAAQLRNFLSRIECALIPRQRRLLYRMGSALMEGAATYA